MSDYLSLSERHPEVPPVTEPDIKVQARPMPRLQLKSIMGQALLDGAWWPRSRDLGQELPSLADHWPDEHGRIARALYCTPDWDIAPRRILSRGSIIPVSAFAGETPTRSSSPWQPTGDASNSSSSHPTLIPQTPNARSYSRPTATAAIPQPRS